jgi:hypothetical protein
MLPTRQDPPYLMGRSDRFFPCRLRHQLLHQTGSQLSGSGFSASHRGGVVTRIRRVLQECSASHVQRLHEGDFHQLAPVFGPTCTGAASRGGKSVRGRSCRFSFFSSATSKA